MCTFSPESKLYPGLHEKKHDQLVTFKLKEGREYREEIIFYHGGKTQQQAAQRNFGCPVIGNIQGQVGWTFQQPDLVNDNPVGGRGWDWMSFKNILLDILKVN